VWQRDRLALTSRFQYVARDRDTYAAAPVNPLDVAGDVAAMARADAGARRAAGRRARAEASLNRSPPTATESALIHAFHSDWVAGTAREGSVDQPAPTRSVTMMHMDNRNIHDKVGGCGWMSGCGWMGGWVGVDG
jgi:hypothetical protein